MHKDQRNIQEANQSCRRWKIYDGMASDENNNVYSADRASDNDLTIASIPEHQPTFAGGGEEEEEDATLGEEEGEEYE